MKERRKTEKCSFSLASMNAGRALMGRFKYRGLASSPRRQCGLCEPKSQVSNLSLESFKLHPRRDDSRLVVSVPQHV
ncbi:hypothetical protein HBI67_001510 [Parastagonospora nodorum]|nr:hypothetical protein HBI67_001510 [Parastagonospora nodorum]KAH6090321.1 hypothetical protein HBI66_018080 [Parastagonospora nodorum]